MIYFLDLYLKFLIKNNKNFLNITFKMDSSSRSIVSKIKISHLELKILKIRQM
jgi:hypothetical protein